MQRPSQSRYPLLHSPTSGTRLTCDISRDYIGSTWGWTVKVKNNCWKTWRVQVLAKTKNSSFYTLACREGFSFTGSIANAYKRTVDCYSTPVDGLQEREIGAGRWKTAGADRRDLAGRERTTVPGVQRAPTPVVTTANRKDAKRLWVLDADLEAAFDRLSYDHILASLGIFPAREFLRAG